MGKLKVVEAEPEARKVHPVAAMFPMMADDELVELADDILANGLIHPIVIDDSGLLIDGRNRLKACEMADIDPTFTTYDGADPVAFILSANINRRNLTAGQRAMAMAMVYPEPGERGRGKKGKETLHFSKMRLSQARTILRHSPDAAQRILAGDTTVKFDEAYEAAATAKARREMNEGRLAQLRAEFPHIAEQVDKQDLTLDEAERKASNEREVERSRRQTMMATAREAVAKIAAFSSGAFVADIEDRLGDRRFADELTDAMQVHLSVADLENGFANLIHIFQRMKG
jgi:hypothetical protein